MFYPSGLGVLLLGSPMMIENIIASRAACGCLSRVIKSFMGEGLETD
jgi:hypothetical protein